MHPSRRSVLVASVLTLAACREKPPVAVDRDVAVRAAALQRELDLQAAYESVMHLHPSLASRLAPLAADKAAHVAALGSTTQTSSAVSTLTALKALESRTATEHGRAALTASRALAPLLASLSASSACAVAAL
ncbi:MAG: hypothetical protein JWO22_4143 [Frankiales bacterium]|nr:hypothetical protein [Frankiales bacterium]